VNGKIYAIGGSTLAESSPYTGGIVATNEEYDPATNTWSFKKPMPTPRMNFGIAVYNNKIYCIGGYINFSSGTEATAANEVYDPATDTWANKASMPTPRLNLRANVVNGKIYLMGGIPNLDTGRTLNEVYDPASDTWTAKAPLPTGVDLYASVVVDSKIFVITSKLNQIYDAESDSWSTGAPPPINSFAPSAATVATSDSPLQMYLFGVNAEGVYWMLNSQGFTTQSYNPATGNWKVGTPMPTGRIDPGVVAMNDKIYVIGGYSYGNPAGTGFTLNRPIIYSTANKQYTPTLDYAAHIDETQLSPVPSNSPSPLPTPQSTVKESESTSLPADRSPAAETQPDFAPFPTVPVAVGSVAMIAVASGLLIHFKKSNLRLMSQSRNFD
jgi:hypothetical protein